jgi:RNA-directed DNA polymerase
VNTGASWPSPDEAAARVLGMQTKLHRWAGENEDRRFDDLYNLVYDPAFLTVAWSRVKGNVGARSAGVDGETVRDIEARRGAEAFLAGLHADLKAGAFWPLPVRERLIPKPGGKRRRLGIPTARDRVVQAALKLVLEPICEADFQPCSYGFRPRRRAQDAIAEIHHLASPNRNYGWVFEADIEACFDTIDHTALLGRVRRRVADKRLLALVKAFLKAGIMTETGRREETITGTPQGGILSPLLANIALSALDEHFARKWEALGPEWKRVKHRRRGGAVARLVRYADDFVVMVHGRRDDAEALRGEVSEVRTLTRRTSQPNLRLLLLRVNAALRGWANYFKHGVSKRSFSTLGHFAWRRVVRWLQQRHLGLNWTAIRRRFLHGWEIVCDGIALYNPATVAITRYRYRGARIPSPWSPTADTNARLVESRMR